MMSAPVADVALLLEGTFPYVRGGVSSWVDQLIRAFPQQTFAVVFIGSRREDYGAPVYDLPPNVTHFEAHYLYETASQDDTATPSHHGALHTEGDARAFAQVGEMHDLMRRRDAAGDERTGGTGGTGNDALRQMLANLLPMLREGRELAQPQFLHSRAAWDFMTERYERHCLDPSFTDYFWTVRTMHKPLWQLARIADAMPPARMYHTVSTGYAGLLGALLRFSTGRPLLVSEHGSYTKERKLDLLQSEWLRDNRGVLERDISQVGYFQNLWMRFFETIGRVCYDAADDIVALFEGNRQRQLADGAPAHKTRNIANGVDVARFAALRVRRRGDPNASDASDVSSVSSASSASSVSGVSGVSGTSGDPSDADRADIPPVVALVGRVVPVKDIKTFLRAIFIAYRHRPDVQGWIIGPETEDPAYAQECRDVAASLGMEYQVRFMGYRPVETVLPHIGVLALSSVSEALPLVVLEAAAAGVPVVTTDVGACRHLIEGDATLEGDCELGHAGRVVPIADPEALAAAIVDVLEPDVWHAASRAGMARVERYYTHDAMCDAYRGLYRRLLAGSAD
ncbi:GT4 family glycosyltransferase PelF [Pandoraea pneumonica]|nr:GT4 family glycosyltransferase PelF [Pandoraea pneumonica]